jgi:hypothetical protein
MIKDMTIRNLSRRSSSRQPRYSGNLARFFLLPGQRHDSIGIEPLITGVDFDALIADKAFDNDALRAILNERGAIAVIPAKYEGS